MAKPEINCSGCVEKCTEVEVERFFVIECHPFLFNHLAQKKSDLSELLFDTFDIHFTSYRKECRRRYREPSESAVEFSSASPSIACGLPDPAVPSTRLAQGSGTKDSLRRWDQEN